MGTRKLAMLLLLPVLALVVAACGSSNKSNTTAATGGASTGAAPNKNCTAQVAVEAPITGPVAQLGGEQLHFAQLALEEDNANEEHTDDDVDDDEKYDHFRGGSFKGLEILVRRRGLEPLCLAALAPQASASANFATSAFVSQR